MSISQELYNRLSETIPPLVRVSNRKQITNWLWIVVGLVLGNSPALSKIATYLPLDTQAESRVTLIRRWLKNLKVDVWAFYEPLLAHVLQGWRAVDVFVILDGVMVFGDRWQVFRVSLQHGGRAIPLIWMVVDGTGVIAVERLAERLGRLAQFLRRRVHRVTFLADRGFRDRDWAKLARKLGWHYDLRITCNTYITLEDGRACRVDELGVPPGQRRYFQNVRVTQDGLWPANLSVGWTEGDAKTEPELLAVISDQTACRARVREYGRRMSIEQSFRDDQSGGLRSGTHSPATCRPPRTLAVGDGRRHALVSRTGRAGARPRRHRAAADRSRSHARTESVSTRSALAQAVCVGGDS